ncbi:Uncharacterised protein [Chlamydia trachomatis]|nr:Uncharacterised protein [Chlamydia trachomatis]
MVAALTLTPATPPDPESVPEPDPDPTSEPVPSEGAFSCKSFSMVVRSATETIFCNLSVGVAVPIVPNPPAFRFVIVGSGVIGKAPCFFSKRKVPVIAFLALNNNHLASAGFLRVTEGV